MTVRHYIRKHIQLTHHNTISTTDTYPELAGLSVSSVHAPRLPVVMHRTVEPDSCTEFAAATADHKRRLS